MYHKKRLKSAGLADITGRLFH